MSYKNKIEVIKTQIANLQKELEELEAIKEVYVVVVKHEEYRNWYKTGEVYKVFSQTIENACDGPYYPLVNERFTGLSPDHIVMITDSKVIEALDAAKFGE